MALMMLLPRKPVAPVTRTRILRASVNLFSLVFMDLPELPAGRALRVPACQNVPIGT
jgi:hypothetical protein